jgi:phosphopantetheinyl transferase
MYSDKERQWMYAQPDQDEAFTLLWTLKEAYGKMLGIGLSAVKDVEFYEDNGHICCSDESVILASYRHKNYLISMIESDSD